jgi:hypothetical protein
MGEDETQDVTPLRPERHPDAELAGPLHDAVGHDPVNPNRRDDEGDDGKDDEKNHCKALLGHRRAKDFLERLNGTDRLIFVGRVNRRTQHTGEHGGRARRAENNVERSKRILRIWLVGLARGFLVDAVLLDVGDDADNLAPDVGTVGYEDALTERVFVREKLPGQSFIDDRDARRVAVIMRVEKPAADEPDAHGVEIVRCDRVIIRVRQIARRNFRASFDLETKHPVADQRQRVS